MNDLSTTITASDIQVDYMKLLIAQLRNQNPLEPLDNNEMASQLSQFAQLQQLESMNSSFASVLETVKRNYASSLIGKDVSFSAEMQDGTSGTLTGVVEQVYNDVDGEILLVVGDYAVGINNVISVKN